MALEDQRRYLVIYPRAQMHKNGYPCETKYRESGDFVSAYAVVDSL
jgi:hypothetical protein